MSPSLRVSRSAAFGLGDSEVSGGTFTVSVGLLLKGAASEVEFGAEGSVINPELNRTMWH